MNQLELRTRIHTGLNQSAGTQYGDIATVEPLSPKPGQPVQLKVTAPDPSGQPRTHLVSVQELSEGASAPTVDAVVTVALLVAQRLTDEVAKQTKLAEMQGKVPNRQKRVVEVTAERYGALTVLAHLLLAAGLIDGPLPSQERAARYLEAWDAAQLKKALNRALNGG